MPLYDFRAKIKTLETMPDPYGNKKAEIRRLRGRLLELAPGEFKEEQENTTINGAKTYEDIMALWDSGKVSRSQYDAENRSLYFELPLDFYNGKRHYKEFLSFEIDETQQKLYATGKLPGCNSFLTVNPLRKLVAN